MFSESKHPNSELQRSFKILNKIKWEDVYAGLSKRNVKEKYWETILEEIFVNAYKAKM